MTFAEAQNKAAQMLETEDSRSHICTLINEVQAAKLISWDEADQLADILSTDRCNARPVLRMLQSKLVRNARLQSQNPN